MLPHIEFVIDLDLIKTQLAAHGTAGAIYYSEASCWWTHQRGHAMARGPLMKCPVGGQVVMEKEWEGWFASAVENPAHYGKHGLRALLAAHHQNCRDGAHGGAYAARSWRPYNEAIDALLNDQGKLKTKGLLRV